MYMFDVNKNNLILFIIDFSLDITIDDATIWDKLRAISTRTDTSQSSPITLAVLYGERHDPTITASMSHITDHNMSLDTVYQSVCEGLVKNIHKMMPCCVLIESGISRLVVSGTIFYGFHKCVFYLKFWWIRHFFYFCYLSWMLSLCPVR